MTPQDYASLAAQIARQAPEADGYAAQAAALQPGINSAQTWIDSCQSFVDAAQASLTEAGSIEGADTTAQQAALTEAQATLDTAKADLATLTGPHDALLAHEAQIRAAIAQCQGEMDASGLALKQSEIDAVVNAPVVPQEVSKRQAKTLMELTAYPVHGNMWVAALAAAEAIPDAAQRIVTRNYLVDSQVYERNRVHGLCGLLGMTPDQADQMLVAASKL